mgnify:CR=1 FL=1
MQTASKKVINGWAMYDWSNSVYSLVIASAIFPAYYNSITTTDAGSKITVFGLEIENTAAYSINLGLAFGIIALVSPLLSSISDYYSNQKRWQWRTNLAQLRATLMATRMH